MRIVILTIAMLAVGPALGGQLDGVETLGNPDAIAAKAAAQFRYVQIWKDGGAMQARCEARQFAELIEALKGERDKMGLPAVDLNTDSRKWDADQEKINEVGRKARAMFDAQHPECRDYRTNPKLPDYCY
jgi:hypothetical protein